MVELYYYLTNTTASVIGCDLYSEGDVIIPNVYNNRPVTEIKKVRLNIIIVFKV